MNATIALFQPEPHLVYPIEEVARITHVPRHAIAVYCRWGLLAPVLNPGTGGWFFDGDSIRRIRRIEYLRHQQGVNLAGIRIIFSLLAELGELHEEMRFRRQA